MMNDRIQLTPDELLMGRMAALIESPYGPSEDYLERYMRVTDMSLDQDTVKNLNNLTPEQHRKVRNIIRWQRIGCIVLKISETLGISLKEALDLFYKSETCRRFLRDSVPGKVCPPHQIPCNSLQRCLLSIKMPVFMDRVCKNRLLSTKRVVFVDGM